MHAFRLLEYLLSAFLLHTELVVSQEEGPHLFAYGWSHTPEIHQPVYLLLLVSLDGHGIYIFKTVD